MEFFIGIIVAVIAVISIFFKGNTKSSPRKSNRFFFAIGLVAAIVGFIGYVFLGWSF